MNMITASRLDILAATMRAFARALPPDAVAAALASLRKQLAELPSANDDGDAARAAELQPLLVTLTR